MNAPLSLHCSIVPIFFNYEIFETHLYKLYLTGQDIAMVFTTKYFHYSCDFVIINKKREAL